MAPATLRIDPVTAAESPFFSESLTVMLSHSPRTIEIARPFRAESWGVL